MPYISDKKHDIQRIRQYNSAVLFTPLIWKTKTKISSCANCWLLCFARVCHFRFIINLNSNIALSIRHKPHSRYLFMSFHMCMFLYVS